MKRPGFPSILLSLLLLAVLLLNGGEARARLRLPAPLHAVMYQPHVTDLENDPAWWQQTLERLQRLKVQELYIQWSRHGDVDFTRQIDPLPEPLVQLLLRQAEALGLKLHIGLYADPDFFSRSKQSLPALAVYLNRLRILSLEQAEKIAVLAKGSPALAGFYLYEEIDDVNWRAREKQDLLAQHLQKSYDELHSRFPELQIAVSSFFTARMTPEGYAKMWQRLTRENSLVVFVQDGAGTGLLDSDERMLYFRALDRNLVANQWSIIVELFRQDRSSKGFSASRGGTADLNRRMNQIKKLHIRPPVAFSLRYLISFPPPDRGEGKENP